MPLCMRGSGLANSAGKCELLSKKEETFTLPGCSTWVFGNAGATGYYRVGYQPEAVHDLAAAAESKLSPGERISLENDIWASVRVGREPVGDYLAFAQGLQSDRNRTVLQDLIEGLQYVGRNLVTNNDRDEYRTWLRQLLTPTMKDVGYEPKPSESDEQKALRARLLRALAYDARDPEALVEARKIADKALADPNSVNHDLAGAALPAAALEGGPEFYDKLMTA